LSVILTPPSLCLFLSFFAPIRGLVFVCVSLCRPPPLFLSRVISCAFVRLFSPTAFGFPCISVFFLSVFRTYPVLFLFHFFALVVKVNTYVVSLVISSRFLFQVWFFHVLHFLLDTFSDPVFTVGLCFFFFFGF